MNRRGFLRSCLAAAAAPAVVRASSIMTLRPVDTYVLTFEDKLVLNSTFGKLGPSRELIIAERIALVREMLIYGTLKSCSA